MTFLLRKITFVCVYCKPESFKAEAVYKFLQRVSKKPKKTIVFQLMNLTALSKLKRDIPEYVFMTN